MRDFPAWHDEVAERLASVTTDGEGFLVVADYKRAEVPPAAGKAKDYLDYTHFSRGGLIEQLEFDGFTRAQATYGVNQAGL